MKSILVAAVFSVVGSVLAAGDVHVPISEAQRGMPIVVQGTVERISDEDEFVIADTTGGIRVYIGPNQVPAVVGERVVVHGIVDDDLGPLEIYASRLTRADGTVVNFAQRYD